MSGLERMHVLDDRSGDAGRAIRWYGVPCVDFKRILEPG
jgi:hypothetical protein